MLVVHAAVLIEVTRSKPSGWSFYLTYPELFQGSTTLAFLYSENLIHALSSFSWETCNDENYINQTEDNGEL